MVCRDLGGQHCRTGTFVLAAEALAAVTVVVGALQGAIFITVEAGIVSGGKNDPGLFNSVVEGPDLITCGSFELESSLIAFLLCTTTGVVPLIMAVRRGKIVHPFWQRD